MTRSEFETLIRPPLLDAIETTRRAIASAGLETTRSTMCCSSAARAGSP